MENQLKEVVEYTDMFFLDDCRFEFDGYIVYTETREQVDFRIEINKNGFLYIAIFDGKDHQLEYEVIVHEFSKHCGNAHNALEFANELLAKPELAVEYLIEKRFEFGFDEKKHFDLEG
jgi:hypothetical protein